MVFPSGDHAGPPKKIPATYSGSLALMSAVGLLPSAPATISEVWSSDG